MIPSRSHGSNTNVPDEAALAGETCSQPNNDKTPSNGSNSGVGRPVETVGMAEVERFTLRKAKWWRSKSTVSPMTPLNTHQGHLAEPSSDLESVLQQLDRALNEERQERLILPQSHHAFLPHSA